MTPEQQERWDRIRQYPLPFAARLARDQGWTPVFTERTIEEYRRFAFLAVVSGHGVTPSKIVDEVWHLHLLYTRHYWEGFCPDALGKPLHHNPAGSGAEDEATYADWYEDTLRSYERIFGETPPSEIWPRAVPSRRRASLLTVVAAYFLGGCAEPPNPLDWHGPAFLVLFAALYAVFFAAALIFRHLFRGEAQGPPARDWRLHVYDQATLNGGANLALAAAISRLVASGALTFVPEKGRMCAARDGGDHALDRTLLRAAADRSGVTMETLRRVAQPAMAEIENSLRRQGLWLSGEGLRAGTILPFLVACLPLALGTAKILVGMERHRPVGFLLIGCVLGFGLNLLLLVPARRSRYGDRILAELRESYRGVSSRPNPDVALGVALFGLGILDGYGYLRPVLAPPSSGGESVGDSSSGCGASSCGGGDYGGGGCGGCGS